MPVWQAVECLLWHTNIGCWRASSPLQLLTSEVDGRGLLRLQDTENSGSISSFQNIPEKGKERKTGKKK